MRISDWSSDVCSSDLAGKETAGSMAMDEGHRQWSQRVRLVISNAKAVPSPGGLGGGEKGGFPRRRLRTAPRGAAAAAKAAPGEGKILPVRSEARRVGQEGGRTGRTGGAQGK